jgi:hypothetical protein
MARRLALTLAFVLFLTGCGPSAEEVSAAILIAGPAIVTITSLILAALAALGKPLVRVRINWRPTLVLLAATVILCVVGAISPKGGRDRLEYAFLALLLVGNMYLAATLVVWRVWAAFQPGAAFTWAQVPLAVILLVPAAVFPVETAEVGYAAIAIAGLYGWPATIVILVGLLLEQIVRGARARRRRPAP